MSENPYKTPESELAINDDSTKFYVVSIKKFTILFFLTVGLYSIYWFYKNWALYKSQTGSSIWPIARAIFAIFFTHRLFSEVQDSLNENEKTFDWNPNLVATIYVILSILSQILDKLSMKEIGSPITDLLSLVIIAFIYLPLLKAQKAINLSQGDIKGQANEKFTAANYIWMTIGVLIWIMTWFGMLIAFNVINID
jgi:hypothetical protein